MVFATPETDEDTKLIILNLKIANDAKEKTLFFNKIGFFKIFLLIK